MFGALATTGPMNDWDVVVFLYFIFANEILWCLEPGPLVVTVFATMWFEQQSCPFWYMGTVGPKLWRGGACAIWLIKNNDIYWSEIAGRRLCWTVSSQPLLQIFQ